MKPLSDNIIFYDTEFSSLDPYEGELLSIGAVTHGGEEFYIEIEYDGPVSDWVRDNIWDGLKDKKVSRQEAGAQLKTFVGSAKPYMISNCNDFDVLYTYKLFGSVDKCPFYWIPIDFASLLFGMNIDPENYINCDEKLFKSLDIDLAAYNQHNALDDARLLREAYMKLIGKKPGLVDEVG